VERLGFQCTLACPQRRQRRDLGGSAFQTFAAATGKARSPMVLCNDRDKAGQNLAIIIAT